MTRALISIAILVASAAAAQTSYAQTNGAQGPLVVIVDPGPTRVNQTALLRAIARATERTVIRMTDERAPSAHDRLTIAFSRPDRWVLRYESAGQVAWTSDRIREPRALRGRLAALSADVLGRVDASAERRRRAWDEDVVIALADEIVDPFADDPPREREGPITVLWSEVVDPFVDRTPRASVTEVWSEVLDPWAL
ncbi:MAG: hypothetical protein RLO52_28060 [Sandaracinaceae bacterium]